jgi:pimeloyl-ACP methyl ester carboxylesterase
MTIKLAASGIVTGVGDYSNRRPWSCQTARLDRLRKASEFNNISFVRKRIYRAEHPRPGGRGCVMPHVTAPDRIRLYYEEAGTGTPVVFVHEYAADYRTWEPQMRYFARSHRCVTFSQRGYPPSDVPTDPARYAQDIARDDVIALMDALAIEKAHVVGHSMGAYTALHVGIRYPQRCLSVTAAGCGWGSLPDPKQCEAMKALAAETGKMFAEEGIAVAAAKYADAPMRQTHKYKDPRGWGEFARMLAEHSAEGHALTMLNLQLKRPTLWEMETQLKIFSVPLLVVVGDEDQPCLEGSLFLKRTVPTAGLLVIPRSGHTVTSEEPAAFNAALAELFAAAEAGRWMSHRPPS